MEKHPYGEFVPNTAVALFLGSFPPITKRPDPANDWFYSSRVNQFWKIMSRVFSVKLETKAERLTFAKNHGFAFADIIFCTKRTKNTSSDTNLKLITYNTQAISEILKNRNIETIFFTSRFVEKSFRRHFKNIILEYPHIELITLPSPSPRYALLSLEEKCKIYSRLIGKTPGSNPRVRENFAPKPIRI